MQGPAAGELLKQIGRHERVAAEKHPGDKPCLCVGQSRLKQTVQRPADTLRPTNGGRSMCGGQRLGAPLAVHPDDSEHALPRQVIAGGEASGISRALRTANAPGDAQHLSVLQLRKIAERVSDQVHLSQTLRPKITRRTGCRVDSQKKGHASAGADRLGRYGSFNDQRATPRSQARNVPRPRSLHNSGPGCPGEGHCREKDAPAPRSPPKGVDRRSENDQGGGERGHRARGGPDREQTAGYVGKRDSDDGSCGEWHGRRT